MNEDHTVTKEKKRSLLQVILTSGFFASASTAFVVYLNSAFLETIIKKEWIGFVFAFAYLITFIVMEFYGQIISKIKNHNALIIVFTFEIISLLLIARNINVLVTLIAFFVLIVGYNITVVNYDVLLEFITKDSETGRLRGIFWTVVNLAYVVCPIVAGFLVQRFDYWIAYLIAALLLIPPWIMIFATYRKNGHEKYKKHRSLRITLQRILRNNNLLGIFVVAFSLFYFYSWMVIYTPIHLLDLGFGWDQIGLIFTVMLLPFVIIEYPAGWLADRYWGETEMISLGFLLMGLAVFALLLVDGFWSIMLVLFLSRVGASLVEIMRDTYFYKKVEADDLDLIDMFRNTRSIAYVIGPLLASALLAAEFSLITLFVVLGVVMIFSVFVPFMIEDTK